MLNIKLPLNIKSSFIFSKLPLIKLRNPISPLKIVLSKLTPPLSKLTKIVEELTNNSVIRLNNYSREQAIEESKRSIQYLEQQLLQTKVKNSQDFLMK